MLPCAANFGCRSPGSEPRALPSSWRIPRPSAGTLIAPEENDMAGYRPIDHLLRRAGFGASPAERAGYADVSFGVLVDRLIAPSQKCVACRIRPAQQSDHLPVGLSRNAAANHQSDAFSRATQFGFDTKIDRIELPIDRDVASVPQQQGRNRRTLQRDDDPIGVDRGGLDKGLYKLAKFDRDRLVQPSTSWRAFAMAERMVEASRSKQDTASLTSHSQTKNTRSLSRTSRSMSPAGIRHPLA